jgi:hypothetical protein
MSSSIIIQPLSSLSKIWNTRSTKNGCKTNKDGYECRHPLLSTSCHLCRRSGTPAPRRTAAKQITLVMNVIIDYYQTTVVFVKDLEHALHEERLQKITKT